MGQFARLNIIEPIKFDQSARPNSIQPITTDQYARLDIMQPIMTDQSAFLDNIQPITTDCACARLVLAYPRGCRAVCRPRSGSRCRGSAARCCLHSSTGRRGTARLRSCRPVYILARKSRARGSSRRTGIPSGTWFGLELENNRHEKDSLENDRSIQLSD